MRYLSIKIIEAEPMAVQEFNKKAWPLYCSGEDQRGYAIYEDDHIAGWVPKKVFEKNNHRIGIFKLKKAAV